MSGFLSGAVRQILTAAIPRQQEVKETWEWKGINLFAPCPSVEPGEALLTLAVVLPPQEDVEVEALVECWRRIAAFASAASTIEGADA